MTGSRTEDRRTHERLPLRVPIFGRRAGTTLSGRSEDVSIGGAKIHWDDGEGPQVGDSIDVEVGLPGRAPLKTKAEVRWRGGKGICGVAFDRRAQSVLAAFFAGLCSLASATATANTTSVPTFDPDADVTITDTGAERPDEYTIEIAFKKQDKALDQCVAQAQTKIEGKAKVSVLLNPDGQRPLGINAKLPKKLQSNTALAECIRGATAAAPFPSYDGPPVVVDLDFEIDPGEEYEEDW